MNPYGDGSDGVLNVTSGTYSLALDTKYQFSSVNISAGATLTTGSTAGSVLYILCSGTFTLNGTVDVSNKVNPGMNSWSVVIDGVTYSSPSATFGGNGGSAGSSWAVSNNGFGGGGEGGDIDSQSGGLGGAGSYPIGSAGGSKTTSRSSNGTTYVAGNNGSGSAGGSGAAYVQMTKSGSLSAHVDSGSSGAGASTYGANGANGSAGSYTITGGSGSITYGYSAAGGGGAGGSAGKPGVHVVIKAQSLVLNGTIITSGTNGQDGGDGGRTRYDGGWRNNYGYGGGGGGGGNAGNILFTYANSKTGTPTLTQVAGSYGNPGVGGINQANQASYGAAGSSGTTTYTQSYVATDSAGGGGSLVSPTEIDTTTITSGGGVTSTVITTSAYQPLDQKDYEYRVYDHAGNYLSTWTDVDSDFGYSQSLNQTPSELTVQLARSPDNRISRLDVLQDASGANILDNNSNTILVSTSTDNTVGPETDVDVNYNVDVYAFYGGYDALLDNNGNFILDNNNEQIFAEFGAPNGKRVYSGYIASYDMVYGQTSGVTVQIVPHATETSHYIFMDGSGNTTVTYGSTTDPVKMARDAMDNYISQGGVIRYSTSSMPLSGQTIGYKFNLQTTRESIDKTIDLLPSGYYQFVDPGENIQYLLQKGTTADHTFWYEQHISELDLKRSITQLVNKVYFVGGDTSGTGAGPDLFYYANDAASIAALRPGLDRQSDSRVTLLSSATALATSEINEYKTARYQTTVTIPDTVYDIETIKLGDMVGFKNFGTFVDNLVLQIVSLNRAPHTITLSLDMIVPNDTKRLYELKKELQSLLVSDIAATPSV